MSTTPLSGLLRARRVYSNFGEEEIIRRLVAALPPARRPETAVDLGAGDGVRHSNTHALFNAGWRGLAVEADARRAYRLARTYRNHPHVSFCRCRVTPHNVVALLNAYEIEPEFGVLSLDIDSYDYWVLDALLGAFRPRLVVTEINEKIPPPIRFVVNYDPGFRLQHHFYGHSIQSLAELSARHGYALVELEYNNAFLAPLEHAPAPPLAPAEAYRRGYLERPDRRAKFRLNEDMEVLHTLTPAAAVEFLNRFYARHAGRYHIGLADAPAPVAPAECELVGKQ
ncbi:MAG TPA: hypothetical protein VF546_14845 [Pyrinomonadaceae bacterium]